MAEANAIASCMTSAPGVKLQITDKGPRLIKKEDIDSYYFEDSDDGDSIEATMEDTDHELKGIVSDVDQIQSDLSYLEL